jgi:hypothetical protein
METQDYQIATDFNKVSSTANKVSTGTFLNILENIFSFMAAVVHMSCRADQFIF